jgi:spore coat polysaccharide biosynthesis protein SpsF
MTVAAFVQARMGSERLPGKSMLAVWREMPLVELVLRRVLAARSLAQVVLVTTDARADSVLVDVARGLGVATFRGSEGDVLDRFARALDAHPADAVVRVCADNPFVEPRAIDELVALFKRSQPCAYASNHTKRSGLPDGIGAELMLAGALRSAADEARSAFDREHVSAFILARPRRFRSAHARPVARPWPYAKLDIDTAEDYAAMCRLAECLPEGGAPLWGREAIVSAWLQTGLAGGGARSS